MKGHEFPLQNLLGLKAQQTFKLDYEQFLAKQYEQRI